jgi:hypothetical protein
MLKKSIALQSTTVENELSFLLSRLQDSKKPFRETLTPHNSTEYPDGIARMVRAVQQAGLPNRIQNKIVVREENYTSIIPSLKDGTGEEVLTPGVISVDALIVTAWQRPQNSVLLEFEYLEHWQQLVISLIQSIRPLIEQEDGNAQLAKEMRIARQRASLENRLGLVGYTLFPESVSFSKLTKATKPEPSAKKNKAFEKRKLIGRTLSPWLKQLTIKPTIAACIAEVKKKPGYKDSNLSEKTMSKILDEYYSGDYEK